jgi:hypothetical protein
VMLCWNFCRYFFCATPKRTPPRTRKQS